ncbi:MAG: YggS family pyridoxal phosphate-dependent enzyme [Micrococcales bacterium]|nr:YggS family pyridoxal phosphate-dependent enzyme [Micrococcales bacterium]
MERLEALTARVAAAAAAAGREPAEVKILLATKTHDAATIRAVLTLPGAAEMLRGENRVQELVAKGPALADLPTPTHLIGPLQSNKINAALRWVTCVESVASGRLADALSARVRPDLGHPVVRPDRTLDVMVQVNVSAEETKNGVTPHDALDLAHHIAALPGLRLTGFMTIGAHTSDEAVVRSGFATLRTLRDTAVAEGLTTATGLSMGMTGDLELAIAEGATIVRVGTAVFGPRLA